MSFCYALSNRLCVPKATLSAFNFGGSANGFSNLSNVNCVGVGKIVYVICFWNTVGVYIETCIIRLVLNSFGLLITGVGIF